MLLMGFALLGGTLVGGLGLYASLDGVSRAARDWGFTNPWVLSAGLDGAIPVFSAANLILIRMNMPLAWVRVVPWALTVVTCWLNIGVGETLLAKIAHGVMPLLWVVFAEIIAHIYAVRIGVATGQRMEKIRRSRWLLAPVSTFIIWRRMTLWEITSYTVALDLEAERQVVRAELREQYGWRWRSRTPPRQRVLLKMGALSPAADISPTANELPPPPEDETDLRQRKDDLRNRQDEQRDRQDERQDEGFDGRDEERKVEDGNEDQPRVSEATMYDIVKAAIEAGEVERFKSPNGDLTGSAIGRAMGQSAGNGRKVRHRLLSRYAAENNIELGPEFTVDELIPKAEDEPVPVAAS